MAELDPLSNIVPIRKPLTPEQECEAEAYVERLRNAARPAAQLKLARAAAKAPRTAEFMMYGSLAIIIAIAGARWLIWGV